MDRLVKELHDDILECVCQFIARHPAVAWPAITAAVEGAAEVVKDAAEMDRGAGPRSTLERLAGGDVIHDGDDFELTPAGEAAVLAFRREKRGAA